MPRRQRCLFVCSCVSASETGESIGGGMDVRHRLPRALQYVADWELRTSCASSGKSCVSCWYVFFECGRVLSCAHLCCPYSCLVFGDCEFSTEPVVVEGVMTRALENRLS